MPLVLTDVAESIAFITLNRPAKLNAVNREMLDALEQALDSLRKAALAWRAAQAGK